MTDKLRSGVGVGSVDVSLPVLLRKTADNTELTGKVHTDVTGSYLRQGGVRTAITMASLGSVNAAHSDGGFVEVDATNQPGLYRFDIPDAAFASGADWVIVTAKVSGAYVFHQFFALTSDPVQGGDSFARLGAPAGASIAADIAAAAARLPATLSSGRIRADVEALGGSASALAALSLLTFQVLSTGTLQAGAVDSLTLASGDGKDWWPDRVLIQILGGAADGEQCTVGSIVGAGTSTPVVTPKNPDALANAPGTAGYVVFAFALGDDPLAQDTPGGYDIGTLGYRIGNFLSGDAYARLGAPAGPSVSADIALALTNLTTALNRIGAFSGSGADTVQGAIAAAQTDLTTLLGRLTATRAGLLDNLTNLDASVASRLATAGYTAPDNATIASIWGAVDTEIATILTAVAMITAIKDKTDLLPASPAGIGDPMDLTSPALAAIADQLMVRDPDGGGDGAHNLGRAIKFLCNKKVRNGSQLDVYELDGSTIAFSIPYGTDAAAEPIVSFTPTD